MRYVRLNEKIFAKTVRLIGPEGEQLGIFPRELALKKSEEFDLDLVEIAPQAEPPVCRIMDFAKYLYEQKKKDKEVRKHQKHVQLKEIRISPRIDSHDYGIKSKHIKEFLEKGHKVRIRMFFRGREMEHKEIGRKVMQNIIQDTEKIAKVEKEVHMLGKTMIMILSAK